MTTRVLRFALPLAGITSLSMHTRAADGDAVTTCHGELNRIGKAFSSAQAKSELEKADCEQRGVLCVDVSGYPLAMEVADPKLKTGESITVKLFGPKSCAGVLTVATDVHASGATLFPPEAPEAQGAQQKGAAKAVEIQQLAKSIAATDITTESVTVFVAREDGTASVEGITFMITPPRYYLDVGVLVAFTPKFQQVSTQQAPGSQDVFIRETNTIRAAAAIVLSYFPAGQYAAPRFTGLHGLGFQAGIGANLDHINDEFYLGLLWEPIPGAGVSAGLALLQMERLQPHFPPGTLVTPDNVPKDAFLGPRFYFGVSLNTQVFQTVLSLGAKARVPN